MKGRPKERRRQRNPSLVTLSIEEADEEEEGETSKKDTVLAGLLQTFTKTWKDKPEYV
jgi:hypothetical protein